MYNNSSIIILCSIKQYYSSFDKLFIDTIDETMENHNQVSQILHFVFNEQFYIFLQLLSQIRSRMSSLHHTLISMMDVVCSEWNIYNCHNNICIILSNVKNYCNRINIIEISIIIYQYYHCNCNIIVCILCIQI